MSQEKSVLIISPGFIGWNVLDLLISEGYPVTGFVRRQSHADQIKASGASTVLGHLDDKAKITSLTLQHDIIFHTATADHLPSVEAILDGIKQRTKEGKSTIFIHTSGTSVLDDGALGGYKSEKIYHDNVREEVDSVPENARHRQIDLALVRAQKEMGGSEEAKAKMAIMIPPLIYGCKSHTPLHIPKVKWTNR
jgi:nucleoside-diphosphate-sugar epimerase